MKILYKSSDIRKEIISLFSKSKGRRVVISAFVGKGAEDYLPNPNGIELICWPKAGSTNPHTIRKLIQNDVKVFFADQVHIKLYWTSDNGAIITSANLTTNALGSGGLIEIGILVDSKQVSIKKIINQLKLDDISKKGSKSLENLDKAHKDFIKRNPLEKSRNKSPLRFREWFATSPELREKWKVAVIEHGGIDLVPSVKNKLDKEYPQSKYNTWMNAGKGEYSENEWVLQIIEGKRKNIVNVEWIYVDKVIQVTKKEKVELNNGFDMQIIQIRGLSHYEHPPFSVRDKKIRNAIKKAFNELFKKRPPKITPSVNFINKIQEYYESL